MKVQKFYDIHFHAFNLSHPNLSAFVQRLGIEDLSFKQYFLGLLGGAASLLSSFEDDKIKKVRNLLSVMDNDLGNFFLIVDYLLQKHPQLALSSFVECEKIVLTPLMMDFGSPQNLTGSSVEHLPFYHLPPKKPIEEQVNDLFSGIKFYYENKLTLTQHNNKTVFCYTEDKKENKLFEIYPFLAVNPKNFSSPQKFFAFFEKYFGDYQAVGLTQAKSQELYDNFYEHTGSFDGNLHATGEDNLPCLFAGVKLYPPLGFEALPLAANKDECSKMDFLFHSCEARGIPITTHCSDGGFITEDVGKANLWTSPFYWEIVLKNYPRLKVNFAHFGNQENKSEAEKHNWKEKIIALIKTYENVYTDISYLGVKTAIYEEVEKLMNDPLLKKKILFGSDFFINLMEIDSYNEYLKKFFTNKMADEKKFALCNGNPECFLFGNALADNFNT